MLHSELAMASTTIIELLDENNIEIGKGTAFFYDFSPQRNESQQYTPGEIALVTNFHVIEKAFSWRIKLKLCTQDGLPQNAEIITLQRNKRNSPWIKHRSVDLCCTSFRFINEISIPKNRKYFMVPLCKDYIPNETDMNEFTPIEDIFMIGFPIGLYDTRNNFPIIRKGLTASCYSIDYKGEKEFLVDIGCFPGSSGSPICIINDGAFFLKDKLAAGPRFRFLGILTKGYRITGNTIEAVDIPAESEDISYRSLINLGHAIKATCVQEMEDDFLLSLKNNESPQHAV